MPIDGPSGERSEDAAREGGQAGPLADDLRDELGPDDKTVWCSATAMSGQWHGAAAIAAVSIQALLSLALVLPPSALSGWLGVKVLAGLIAIVLAVCGVFAFGGSTALLLTERDPVWRHRMPGTANSRIARDEVTGIICFGGAADPAAGDRGRVRFARGHRPSHRHLDFA